MGDKQSRARRRREDFVDRAYQRFGHLTKDELIQRGEGVQVQLRRLRREADTLITKIWELEEEDQMIGIIFMDELNGRRRS